MAMVQLKAKRKYKTKKEKEKKAILTTIKRYMERMEIYLKAKNKA